MLELAGTGRQRLWVDGNAAGCATTSDPPQVTLDPFTAMRVLFGPLPAHMGCAASLPAAFDSRCPLPLHIPSSDRV